MEIRFLKKRILKLGGAKKIQDVPDQVNNSLNISINVCDLSVYRVERRYVFIKITFKPCTKPSIQLTSHQVKMRHKVILQWDPCMNRNFCAAVTKKILGSFGIPHIGALHAPSHELSPAKLDERPSGAG